MGRRIRMNEDDKMVYLATGVSVDEIKSMSHKELQQAVLRIFSLPYNHFEETDSWRGVFLLPDDIIDAFRGR